MKVVAFDVFGTIADGNSHPGPYARIVDELGVNGRQLSNVAQTQNVTIPELIALLAPGHSESVRSAVAEKVEADLERDLERIFLFPETVEVLSALQSRGLQTALVSNLAKPYAQPIIDRLQEKGVLPATLIWSFEVGAKKPDPLIYEALFERVGVSPQEILFVGDKADRDLWPPRTFGCQSRLIARPQDPHFQKAIKGVSESDRLTDLKDIFSILNVFPNVDSFDLKGLVTIPRPR